MIRTKSSVHLVLDPPAAIVTADSKRLNLSVHGLVLVQRDHALHVAFRSLHYDMIAGCVLLGRVQLTSWYFCLETKSCRMSPFVPPNA